MRTSFALLCCATTTTACVACGTSPTTSDAGADGGDTFDATSDVGTDGTATDASKDGAADVSSDAPTDSPVDADADADVVVTYNDLTSQASWLGYDLTGVDSSTLQGYAGGTFDGRYVYYAPTSTTLLRYDTQSNAFTTKASWETFTASLVQGTYLGAVFDGHYVYFVPSAKGEKVLRYDTTLPFGSASSYASFDPTQVAAASAFAGATFDGRYLYFAPWYVAPNYESVALRYDTTAAFGSASSWESYDLSNAAPTAAGYYGCVFDGKYVTFVPLRHGTDLAEGLVVRFDTSGASFSAAGSWSTFDTTTLDVSAAGFAGGAFDGKDLYLAPDMGYATRYDTTGSFTAADAGAWTVYNTFAVDPQVSYLATAGFDGRYVYYGTSFKTKIARVDTTAPFNQKSSWSVFDLASTTPAGGYENGMIYDGRYMYFPPSSYTKVTLRFDTKSANVMPKLPQFHGSFF